MITFLSFVNFILTPTSSKIIRPKLTNKVDIFVLTKKYSQSLHLDLNYKEHLKVLHYLCQADPAGNLIGNIFSVDMPHPGARDVLHPTTTHPHLQKHASECVV